MIRRPARASAAVLALVLAAGTACSSGDGPSEGPETATPAQPAAPTVFPVVDLPPAQVHRVAVEGGGKAVALVRSSSATWLPEPGTPEETVSLMAETEDEVLPLQAYRRLDADAHAGDFGLASPEFLVRISDPAGVDQVVAVGSATFSGAGYYARRDGEPGRVFLLVRRTVDNLRSLLRGERVNSPRSAEETRVLDEAGEGDPEEVTNPWLAQVLEEARP